MSVQKIEPLGANELLLERQNADMETLYLGANYRGASDVYLLTFTTDEATWLQFKASVPKGAIVYHRFFWSNDAVIGAELEPEEKPAKKKEPAGPHSFYWREMFRRGFFSSPELCEVLDADSLDAESAKQLLHDAFETTSLSLISPEVFENFCATHELTNLFNMSRTAAAKVEQDVRAS